MDSSPYSAPNSAISVTPRAPRRFVRQALAHGLLAALCLAGYLWSQAAARAAQADAIREFGHNVDSGAYLSAAGFLYFVPAVPLFALASVASYRGWRLRLLLQAVAWLWLASPWLVLGVSLVRAKVAP